MIKQALQSVSSKLLLLILCTLIPMSALLAYINSQARDTLLGQITDAHQNVLNNYISQVDSQLQTATSYCYQLANQNLDSITIASGKNANDVQYATYSIYNDMSEQLLTNNFIDLFFTYIETPEDEPSIITAHSSFQPTSRREIIRSAIEPLLEDPYVYGKWQLLTIEGVPCLFEMFTAPGGIHAGACVRLSNLSLHFPFEDNPDSSFSFVSDNEYASLENQLEKDMLLLHAQSSVSGFSLVESFSKNTVLNALPFMQKYTLLVTVLLIAVILIALLAIYRIVTAPLLRLMQAMKHIQAGELDYRIPIKPASTEIRMINETFNQMIDDVSNLKIDVYEQKITAQKFLLRTLQLQIKPHFLINSLNMVYNLIETKDLDLAQNLIQCSIRFFRFMVRVDEELVPLTEEIEHVQAYLNIQSIRYQSRFDYSVSLDDMISDILVPPLLIQSFVENSIKYGYCSGHPLSIQIEITSFEENDYPFARIRIIDNGTGFPPEILPALNDGCKVAKEDGFHIGIYNVTQRLSIQYGEQAKWLFYNDCGAVCEFILPAKFPEFDDSEGETDTHTITLHSSIW